MTTGFRARLLTLFLVIIASAAPAQRRAHSSSVPSSGSQITLMEPGAELTTTTRAAAQFMARVQPGAATEANINGTTVPVYSTGVFVRDNIPLELGPNTLSVSAPGMAATTLQIVRVPEAAKPTSASLPLAIDPKSIVPTENVALMPGDDLEISFKGSPGNLAECQLPGGTVVPMGEQPDIETSGASTYRTTVRFAASGSGDADSSQPITVRLRSTATGASNSETAAGVSAQTGRVMVYPPTAPEQLVRVKPDQVGHLAFGLTEVRLGGPYLAELTSGTVLRVVGRRGFNLKVQLTPDQYAWIPAYEIEPAPPGTAVPHVEFTDMNTTITQEGDEALLIPYAAPVPFAVKDVIADDAGGSPSVAVDLYGAHNACTWITHRKPGKIIRQVTIDQVASDHLRVTAHLQGNRLWGYRWQVDNGTLRVTLRHAPAISHTAASPLAGLTIAVEAGHGGSNSGARGITGSNEKDVTLAVSRAVEQQLTAAGAKVVQTRIGDESVGLSARAERAMTANADLFVSIHCNSAGNSRGYLSVAGNALFYKHAFNHELATEIHQHILEQTGLRAFGVIGNFNYAPVRILTWMPAVLVEQAFISNPEEEAQMLDPAFQQKMARGIVLGLEEYLRKP